MDEKVFTEIGLTNSERKVYLTLLKIGIATKGPIVKHSKISSGKIYEVLDKLANKGLVSSIKKSGVKHFIAAHPSKIKEYVKRKEDEIKTQMKKLDILIPEMNKMMDSLKSQGEAEVFTGLEGARTSFEDIISTLKKGEEYYVLGISKFTKPFENFVLDFHKRRAKKGIKCKMIINELMKKTGKKLQKMPYTKVSFLRKEIFTPVVFIIYKEKTLISIGLEGIFIRINSKSLSDGLRTYAAYMYKIGKKG